MTAPLVSTPGAAIPGRFVPGMPSPGILPPPFRPPPAPPGHRLDGSRGIVYMGIAAGAAASPVAFVDDWSVSVTADRIEVTPLGAIQKSWVAGLIEFKGDFAGWYDDATSQTYISATDGVPRNFYLYPAPGFDPGQCFYGMIVPDFAVASGVESAAAVKCSWSAAGVILRSPAIALLQDEAYQDILDEAYGVMS